MAGESAGREAKTRRERREEDARKRFGRLGSVYVAVTTEPQSTRAWENGSAGERSLGAFLDGLHNGETIIVLHDRRIPASKANIDHIAITRSGVFVIDTKRYTGTVRLVDRGRWFRSDKRLYVAGRDRSKLVHGMAKQVAAVSAALGEALIGEFEVSIRPALCFVDADWQLFARPFELAGVWIGWPKKLRELVGGPGPLQGEHVRTLARRVAAALPPA